MSGLTLRQLVAAVTDALESAGYKRGETLAETNSIVAELRIFEDLYGIVAVASFEQWSQLANGWTEVQGMVANAIASKIGRNEPKAWDGYLVLLTPESPPPGSERLEMRIQYDTSLLRKFVGTGRSIKTLADISRLLSPLLPIRVEVQRDFTGSVVDQIPALLEQQGLDRDLAMAVIRAFTEEESIPATVHAYMWQNETSAP